ncbi:MAG: hypothetical protein RMX96_12655 [Nostoc sp. ChiSLP02]|nr:hypothetical protein [Nostoc sp. DedSLP05]MDZ8098217.1 hypothetical protein [Nostoc sp. DedSLP01]MDZ8185691.1 hypothetical protein [Nostoc sp. ChiSLP02]
MKLAPLVTSLALVGFFTVWDAPLKVINPSLIQASAAEELPLAKKLESLTKIKGQFGSGDQLRRFFFGDLEPIGIQPGGAGHVVNLYNKANDVTFSYCSTYDVVVAIKKGKVAKFEPNEVK